MKSMRALLLFFWLVSGAMAAEISPQKRNFSVCTHELPPHSMKLEDGSPGGIASEILRAVSRRLGWQLTTDYYPWMRARNEAEKGNCDLIYTILKKAEYEKFAIFPKEHLEDRHNVLIVREDSKQTYDGNLETFMRQNKVGTYRDKAVSPLFDRLKLEPWVKLEHTAQPESIVRMLLSGRVDAVIENKATAVYVLRVLGKTSEARILSPPVSVTPAFIAFTKKGQALPFLTDFERELKAFKLTDQYRAITSAYQDLLK